MTDDYVIPDYDRGVHEGLRHARMSALDLWHLKEVADGWRDLNDEVTTPDEVANEEHFRSGVKSGVIIYLVDNGIHKWDTRPEAPRPA